VLAVDPEDSDAVLAALDDRGTPAAVVGHVEPGEGVVRDGTAASRPTGDASWPVYERLRERE
jgi:hydrogenase maturation factor